jgi:PmbA protein
MPYLKDRDLQDEEKEVSLKDILKLAGNGILVSGFNGGNRNPVTGDFSFGIEGFAFSKGRLTHPVREMLITGNIIELWNNLLAAGSDARPSSRWQIPTLAFEGVIFSA